MEVIRVVNGFELNKGNLSARGLYNITKIECDIISDWFDEEVKDELLELSDNDFIDRVSEICKLGE